MRVALRKVDGVEAVEVSLNRGQAHIRLRPGNRVPLERLRQAVADQGFTPREAVIRARGQFAVVDGRLAFRVTGPDTVYPVRLSPGVNRTEAEILARTDVIFTVRGTVHAPKDGTGPVLEVTEVREGDSGGA